MKVIIVLLVKKGGLNMKKNFKTDSLPGINNFYCIKHCFIC